jgi:hypothetical protein
MLMLSRVVMLVVASHIKCLYATCRYAEGRYAHCSSTVVEHLPDLPKFKGSSPATIAGTGREKMANHIS